MEVLDHPVSGDGVAVPGPETAGIAPGSADKAADATTADPDARRQRVFDYLDRHGIAYTWYEHPEAPTGALALHYCHGDGARHCKNLFLRNHKGDRHYLVCFDAAQRLAIRDLEQRLHQGKLTFASEQRMERWLGLRPGSVSVFGLINDPTHHVHLFLDSRVLDWPRIAFHPNDNRATVILTQEAFRNYLSETGHSYDCIDLY